MKTSELLRVGRTAALVATLGVIVPFLLGWGSMRLIGIPNTEAIFVGAALMATSVGITAQVLASKGLLGERACKVILAAAVIDDVLGLLVLAGISGLAGGVLNVPALITTAVLAVFFTLLVAIYGSRTLNRILPHLERRLTVQERQFHVALAFLFGLSVCAAFVGVAAVVGAFLAGMALSESVDRRSKDLANGITELLVPFFLVGIGLHLNLGAFTNRSTLVMALMLCILAVLGKFVGCGVGAWSLGRRGMIRVGVGMIPRGEVGMIVAQLGLALGIVDQQIYASAVAMAIITTLIGPPLLSYVFRTATPNTRKEEEFTFA